jgi:hypothetical protein
MRRCSGGRGENHVRFQRAAVVSRSRGEPGAAANDPMQTSDLISQSGVGCKFTSIPLTHLAQFDILPIRL